jgi:hypothetical protein
VDALRLASNQYQVSTKAIASGASSELFIREIFLHISTKELVVKGEKKK